MYELGLIGDLANLLFALVGIWMVHVLYRTPRRRWQAVTAWIIIHLVCALGVWPITWLLPSASYERASMLIGFSGIFVYMYLFPQIPVAQRFFTYFFVDTTMTLVVLLARTTSVLLAPHLPLHPDLLFSICYFPLLAGFIALFYWKLKKMIVDGLQIFQNHLTILAIFAATGYVTLLLLVDLWAVWHNLDFWEALTWYGLTLLIVLGYLLSFRTLSTLKRQIQVEQNATYMAEQMTLLERYYRTLAQRMEEVRIFNHDMHYHFTALSGLCMDNNMDGIRQYVEALGQNMPDPLPQKYCAIGGLNAILEYYANLCRENDIRFHCQVQIPAEIRIEPVHLCIVFGNAVLNGIEAVQEIAEKEKRYLRVSAAVSGHKLVIKVQNPGRKIPVEDGDGNYISAKAEPGHGFGLRSIHETVRLYGGWCKTIWADGVFTLQAILHENTV